MGPKRPIFDPLWVSQFNVFLSFPGLFRGRFGKRVSKRVHFDPLETLRGYRFQSYDGKNRSPWGSMTPGGVIFGVIFGHLFLAIFWQNCGFMTTKIGKRGSKNDPKMAKNDPFFDPFFDLFFGAFLVLFWQFP